MTAKCRGKFKKQIFWLIYFLSLLTFQFFSSIPLHAVEPVKICLLLSGPRSSMSTDRAYRWGAEMAVGEVNSSEGRQGVQLILVLRRGPHFHRKALKELRELLLEEQARFLMGVMDKEDILPVSRIARELNIPFLVFPIDFIEAASTVGEPGSLFWISPAPEAFQRAAVRTVAAFSAHRYYLLARNSSIGRSWAQYFWEELRKLKPTAQRVGETFLPTKVQYFKPYIQGVLSAKAEVCISQLGVPEWPDFVELAKKQDYFKKVIHFEMESGGLESLIALGKKAPEGVWGASAFPFWALGWKETKEFVQKFKEKHEAYPNLSALSGYITIYAIFETMKKLSSYDYEKAVHALETLRLRTPIGSLAIRRSDHRVMWPIWCGSLKYISDYPFPILGDLKAFGPDSFSP
jgi:branched-chain amino acid transport system substrate-binding protein